MATLGVAMGRVNSGGMSRLLAQQLIEQRPFEEWDQSGGKSGSKKDLVGKDALPGSPGSEPPMEGLTQNSDEVVTSKELLSDDLRFRKIPWWITDPRKSKLVGYWDTVTSLALIFTALVTPYEVGLLPPSESASEPLFIINRVIDFIFVVDICLQFTLAYQENSETGTGRWIFDSRRIALSYLKTWFLLDILSVGVSAFDINGLFTVTSSIDGPQFKALRVARALRLIKMVRLVRASRIFKRWETRMEINYTYLSLSISVLTAVITSHWMACLWSMQAQFMDISRSWLVQSSAGPFCDIISFAESGTEHEYVCVDAGIIYAAALYFAITTITSVGYGDISATPRNTGEIAFMLCLALWGATIWANVIGNFCAGVSNIDPDRNVFRQQITRLNQLMRARHLPQSMRQRVREYFIESQPLRVGVQNSAMYHVLSPTLQGEVVLQSNEQWLRCVWFLRDADRNFMVQLSLSLQPMLFAPREILPIGNLYIVQRCIALYGGRMLTAGKVWGEDIILTTERLQRTWSARAMTYLEVHISTKQDFTAILDQYPAEMQRMRKYRFLLALKREIVRLACHEKLRMAQKADDAGEDGIGRAPSLAEASQPESDEEIVPGALSGGQQASIFKTMAHASMTSSPRTAGQTLDAGLLHRARHAPMTMQNTAASSPNGHRHSVSSSAPSNPTATVHVKDASLDAGSRLDRLEQLLMSMGERITQMDHSLNRQRGGSEASDVAVTEYREEGDHPQDGAGDPASSAHPSY